MGSGDGTTWGSVRALAWLAIPSVFLMVTVPNAAVATAGAPPPTLRLLISDAIRPPFAFRDDQGRPTGGIAVAIGRALARELGGDVVVQGLPRRRLFQELRTGGGDLVCVTNPDWVDSMDGLAWSGRLYDHTDILYGPADGPAITSVDEIAGPLGLVGGYAYPPLSEALRSGRVTRVDAGSEEGQLRMVIGGRVKWGVLNALSFRYLARTLDPGRRLAAKFAFPATPVGCMASATGRIGVDALRMAAAKLVASRQIDRIIAETMAETTSRGESPMRQPPGGPG